MIEKNTAEEENIYLPVIGDQNLLTGSDCFDQTRHNFKVRKGWSTRSSMLIPGKEYVCLSVCPALHTNGLYPISVKKKLSELLRLKKVTILVFFYSRTWVTSAWWMWLAGLLQAMIPDLPHFFDLRSLRRGTGCVPGKLSCIQATCTMFEEKWSGSGANRNDGTERNDKTDKGGRQNDWFPAASTDLAEDSDR